MRSTARHRCDDGHTSSCDRLDHRPRPDLHHAGKRWTTLVGNGDTVNIDAGVYPSDVARWQADDLVLRGIGGFAHLESNGLSFGAAKPSG